MIKKMDPIQTTVRLLKLPMHPPSFLADVIVIDADALPLAV